MDIKILNRYMVHRQEDQMEDGIQRKRVLGERKHDMRGHDGHLEQHQPTVDMGEAGHLVGG